jgi:hypothetical protein
MHGQHFIENADLERLAREQSAGLVIDPAQSVDNLLQRVGNSLLEGRPFSLIRVGNGEGNAYGMTLPLTHETTFETFCTEFNSQNHWGLDVATAQAFSRDVVSAIDHADMLGFRSFRFDENAVIERSIDDGNAYAALGIAYARHYLRNRLEAGRMQGKQITSAWIHLDIAQRFDALLALGRKVIVITGREELRNGFAERLGDRLAAFLSVPVQGYVPPSFGDSHYGQRFGEICEYLKQDLSGHLVLVGAGLFGKIYCDVAARYGGVALDLGSLFDVLSGHDTRPVFSVYDFSTSRWVENGAG